MDTPWIGLLGKRASGCVTHHDACGCRSEAVRQVLRDVLAADGKAGNAPMSSESHTDRALVLLKWLCNDWVPDDIEMKQRISEAEEHMRFYRPSAKNEGRASQ